MNFEQEIKNQIVLLNKYTELYNQGISEISDKEWDNLYFKLAELEQISGIYLPDSPTQSIPYKVVDSLKKITHNHPMLSLDKTKDWNEFINYFGNKDVIGMLKLDGLTCSLHYENGKLVSAETRGNGLIGEDILHNALVIKSIPKEIEYKDNLTVDGEIICTENDFIPFSNEYANPRNFASGSIRLLSSLECAKRHLTFVAWNMVHGYPEADKFLTRLNILDSLGFIVTPWTSSFDWDAKEFLINKAKELGYPIDGLVGRFDDIAYGENLGTTGHHSRAAYAFKFYDEEYETTLKDIEWTMGRTGVLTPVAVFEPIDTGDSVIERASLHNLSVMDNILGWAYQGQKIKVAKMNMIIPQIVWADTSLKQQTGKTLKEAMICPVCGFPTSIVESASGVSNLICNNPNCEGKLINRLDHFCSKKGLDIKGLSKATLEKLIDWEWVNSIVDIYHLQEYKSEWIKKPGFGVKSVENILAAIENSRTCELHSFIAAIGIPLIGSTYAKQLAKEDEDWTEFRDDTWQTDFSIMLDGFGPEMNAALHNFDYTEADKLVKELNIVNSLFGSNNSNNDLTGINIVITGKLNAYKNRAELQNAIENAGGKVLNSVSKNTNYLINNDTTSNSSKNIAAQKLGIPILSETEFIKKFFNN